MELADKMELFAIYGLWPGLPPKIQIPVTDLTVPSMTKAKKPGVIFEPLLHALHN